MKIPFVESARAQTGFGIFRRLSVLDTDELRVDVVAELEREEEEGALGSRLGGHGQGWMPIGEVNCGFGDFSASR